MKKLKAKIISKDSLTDVDRDQMWQLFTTYYEGTSRDIFERDLAQKQKVIVLRDSKTQDLQGFSTLQLYRKCIEGRDTLILYTGDTIINREYWGQTALQKTFVSFLVRTKLQNPFTPVYWFLISKGYKTYLLLSRNFIEYWPRFDQPTPSWEENAIATLSKEKFGDSWNPKKGILHFSKEHDQLKQTIAPITPDLLKFSDIKFFVEKNPGHEQGDELCCLGKADFKMFYFFCKRVIRHRFKKKP